MAWWWTQKPGTPLPFVHLGVQGQNLGQISDDRGRFALDLSTLSATDSVTFSMIGYHTLSFALTDGHRQFHKVSLRPATYDLGTVIVRSPDRLPLRKMGRFRASKTTIGESGFEQFGFGGEWATLIKYEGMPFLAQSFNFHTRFNTVDSVLFRVNIYALEQGLPGPSLLHRPIYTKSYRGGQMDHGRPAV